MRTLFFCFLYLFIPLVLPAQDTLYLEIEGLEKLASLKKKIQYTSEFSDSLSLKKNLQDILSELHNQAYLEASFDTIIKTKNKWTAHLYLGKPYAFLQLQNGNISKELLDEIGFREKSFRGKPLSYKRLLVLQERLLQYMENHGHPFAQVYLDSLTIDNQQLSARLFLQRNKRIFIDSIKIIGKAKIKPAFLHRHLGILKGTRYDQRTILGIKRRLQNLAFLRMAQDPKITFRGDKARINLFLEKKQSSRFDILFGVLPNNDPLVPRKLLITGSGLIELQNAFGVGERIRASFQQLRPETQDLEVQFAYPYLLRSPIGVQTEFNLYKRDTNYLDLIYNVGLQYFFEGEHYIQVFWKTTQTNLLTIQASTIRQNRQLPENLDIKNTQFGLEYYLQRLDYRFNPRSGWDIRLKGAVGRKQITRNPSILDLKDDNAPDFDFATLYDGLTLQSFQYHLEGKVDFFMPIAQRSTLKIGVQNAMILSQAAIFQNEAFRLGGNQLLRGFDEEALFASLYTVLSLEYRWLLAQNSALYLFADGAYLENKTQQQEIYQRPLGFGAGIRFDTAVGIFGVSLAVGRDFNNSVDFFDFRSPKIHFGYVSLF